MKKKYMVTFHTFTLGFIKVVYHVYNALPGCCLRHLRLPLYFCDTQHAFHYFQATDLNLK